VILATTAFAALGLPFYGLDFEIFGEQTNSRTATFFNTKTASCAFIIVNDNSAVRCAVAAVYVVCIAGVTAITISATAIAVGASNRDFSCSVWIIAVACLQSIFAFLLPVSFCNTSKNY